MNAQHYASQVITSNERQTQGKLDYVLYSSGKHSFLLFKQGLKYSGGLENFLKQEMRRGVYLLGHSQRQLVDEVFT